MTTKKIVIVGVVLLVAYWLWKKAKAQASTSLSSPSGQLPIAGTGPTINPLDPIQIGLQFGLQQSLVHQDTTDVFPQGGLAAGIGNGIAAVLSAQQQPILGPQP